MVRVRYRGPSRGAAQLSQMMMDEGLEAVDYAAPMEKRSGGLEQVAIVTVIYVGDKVADAVVGQSVESLVKKALAKFKDRHKDAPFEIEARIDEDE